MKSMAKQALQIINLSGRYWWVIFLWILYIAFTFLVYNRSPVGAGDFSYYYRGAVRLLNGTHLYTNLNARDYVGPMLVVQFIAPLASGRTLRETANLWYFINIFALLVSLWMLGTQLSIERRRLRLGLWLVPLIFIATFQSLWLGQITIILLLTTIAVWAAYRRGLPILSGIILAFSVWTKFYPGLLIIYFAWKREWRVLLGVALGMVLSIGLQILSAGWDVFIYYYINVLPNLVVEGQPNLNHSNNSVLGFAQKMFSPSPQIIPVLNSELLVNLTRYGLTALLAGSILYLTIRPWQRLSDTPTEVFDLEYALVLTVALLLGSTLGLHGTLSMLLPLFILWKLPFPPQTRLRVLLLTILAVVLVNTHWMIILGYLQPPSDQVLPALLLSLPFFGMMIFWGLLVWGLWRQRMVTEKPAGVQSPDRTPAAITAQLEQP